MGSSPPTPRSAAGGCAGQSPGPGLALGLDPGQDGEPGLPLSPGTSCDDAGLNFSQNEKCCVRRRNILAKLYRFWGGGVSSGQGNSPQKVETHHHHFYQRADFSLIDADGKFTSSSVFQYFVEHFSSGTYAMSQIHML